MKLINVWKSTITGAEIEAPADFLPQFGGWELVGSYWKS